MRFAPFAAVSRIPGRSRHICDWLGFTIFSLWAAVTLSKMPAVGLFLLPSFLFEIAVAFSFLVRDQPKMADRSLRARLSAYGGSFFVIVFLQVSQQYFPEWFTPRFNVQTLIGLLAWIGGILWAAYSVWHLRRGFSIEPQARRLITSGPYGVARHPIYTGYFLQYAGMWLAFPTPAFALALLLWSLMMLDRMRLEEAVLARAFPEYATYRRRVGALATMPPLRHRPPARA
jgi:protein-S-isoprenylcysteine O-methyltransferase Ste14